jgi:hypothetical protein
MIAVTVHHCTSQPNIRIQNRKNIYPETFHVLKKVGCNSAEKVTAP